MSAKVIKKGAFEKQVVVITGGARGIGRATALEFSRQGAFVTVVDVLEKEMGEVCGSIKKMGRKALALKADVSDNEQVQEVVQKTFEHFGSIDILVNNAGIVGPIGPIINLDEKDWDAVFQINLKGAFLVSKSIAPIMIKNKKGNIVNVASIAGKEGSERLGAYSASKAGLIGFSRVLAKELVSDGIRVNCIAPALVSTEILSPLPQKFLDKSLLRIPMKRMGHPEEVADLILFLASDKSSYITGQCYNITGGRGDY
ncbi:MAG: SDR family oxidoreductase [Deltaproteobacteria bacterium]|nr:SDR family oxidoreductase [Deltaproteobacteria bacterium]